MRIQRLMRTARVSHGILRAAALLVPGTARAEWIAEWRGELWQALHTCKTESSAPLQHREDVTAFCLGAFQDALWLRRNDPQMRPRSWLRIGSPSRCGFTLAICAVASMLICAALPGARRAMRPSPYRHAGDLVMISYGGASAEHLPTIRFSNYQSWKSSTRKLFTDLAFYEPSLRRIHVGPHRTVELSVAYGADNLFDVLGVPLSSKAPEGVTGSGAAGLVLSQRAWRKYFHGDLHIAGRAVDIAGREVKVVGVLPESEWQLPGRVDAWVLEDEQHLDAMPSRSKGFVLAHVRAGAFPVRSSGLRSMTVFKDGGEIDHYDCISLEQRAHEPFSIFLFTLLLAFLALPATTPLPLGEYPAQRNRLPSVVRFRRWLFLAVKISLILPVVYFSSLDLAYAGLPLDSPDAQYIQMAVSFFGFLFALRWALQDQRKRCPVCLRLLTNPARVGQASQNFLAWNGTELMCSVGHGLLHIPELPTSWFSTQRWLYLDASWSSLFSDSHLASAGIP